MCNFILKHWEWTSGFTLGLVSLYFTIKAYYNAKSANQGTDKLIKQSVDEIINITKGKSDEETKEKIKERIITAALSEWRIKGQASEYLKHQFEELKHEGWAKEEFENIYKNVSQQHKGRPPKKPLFEE